MPELSARDVTVRRGEFELTCPSWRSRSGLTAVVGLNGAGKSTLLLTLAGVLAPDSGSVRGAESTILLPQDANVRTSMTVHDFLTYIAMLRDVDKNQRAQRVEAALSMCGLHPKATVRVNKLSGGWQRRVAIAQALLVPDRVVLLDEPTVSLDVSAARAVWQLLQGLGVVQQVVVATHEASAVLEFADTIVPVMEGHVGSAVSGHDLRTSFDGSGLSAEAFLLQAVTASGTAG